VIRKAKGASPSRFVRSSSVVVDRLDPARGRSLDALIDRAAAVAERLHETMEINPSAN
jgi:hypothetical protein